MIKIFFTFFLFFLITSESKSERTYFYTTINELLKSMEKIWARATGHLMGNSDEERPDVPILTLREARIALYLKTFWVGIHVITCLFIIANIIWHW